MHRNAGRILCGWTVAAFLLSVSTIAQTAAATPTFETASVRPAPDDAPAKGTAFMVGLRKQPPPRGLLTMTAPLAPFLMFAYDIQDEVEARAFRARLPEWAQRQRFTIVARPPQDAPTQEQIRLMMRALLEDRFALKVHRENHTGPVKNLTVLTPGKTGPGLKAHDASQPCRSPEATAKPSVPDLQNKQVDCGLDLHPSASGMFHVSMTDVSLPEACTLLGGLGGVLGGRGMDTIVDNTGLSGKWDIVFDFLPERDGPTAESAGSGPTFTSALEKQLGLQLKKGTGQVEDLIIDHIAEPQPD